MNRSSPEERFAEMIRLRTVSRQPGQGVDLAPFVEMAGFLHAAYPEVHRSMSREVVQRASLLYLLPGEDPDLLPVMLTAHLDVVPADDESQWPYPPFSGTVAQGRIWGRGSIDYKLGVAGILEACEGLLSRGIKPCRTLILAFGHDEETGGDLGASSIVESLEERGIRLSSVLDEGGYVYRYPWLDREVAVIGMAEKGYLTLRLTARGEAGHASVPESITAAGRLCRCLACIEEEQLDPLLCPPVRRMLEETSKYFTSVQDSVDTDGLAGLIAEYPEGNALVRTTTAITMMQGSSKENVIAAGPHALVNFRAVPGHHSDDIVGHVSNIAERFGIEVDYEDTNHIHQPSLISSGETEEYAAIEAAIGETWPGMPVVQGIFPAATDSRHYCRIADNVYRFEPVHLGQRGLSALHSHGESIPVEDLASAIGFYAAYVRRMCWP